MGQLDVAYVADLWEENQEYLKQRLGYSDSTLYNAHWVLMPDVPQAKFNHASLIRVSDADVEGMLASCHAYFKAEGLSIYGFLVTPATQPASFGQRLSRMGFYWETNPVMLWNGVPFRQDNPRITVRLADRNDSPVLFDLIQHVFFPGATRETLVMGRRAINISYDLGAYNYIAYLDGLPVGAGMLYVRGEMGGIYNMCTLPHSRGRGVATAILAAILADAPRLGCRYVGLTPTAMGRPLYERLGFREIYQEMYFAHSC
ncbi:MAG: GNAT family N-acetyltransferase [Mycobacterium leprae]